jgi:sulfate adenylyltransferase
VFCTDDRSHPGVEAYLERDDFLVGGEITMFETRRYNEYDLLPVESRVLFEHMGWQRIVGFQTRNAPHRAHEYIQKTALEMADGLLVQPKLGEKKPGDYRDGVIMGTYRTLIDNYYPENTVALSVFPSTMRYAGPREAVFDAIVRKNQGCTHFIVGRDHAGVEDYYGEYDAQHLFREIEGIGITPLFFDYSFYCEACDGMASAKTCPHDDADRVYPSGSKIRELIRDGDAPSERIMRPEVTEYVTEADAPFVDLAAETGGTR